MSAAGQLAFIGIQELIIILVIVLVLFGGKKIPELARNMGKSVKEVKKGFEEETTEDTNKKA